MSCSETAQPIDLPFGLWTRVGRRKHKFSLIRQMAPMCPHGRAHWRHLANTVEPSVCGGDVVLCQITLTTCFLFSVARVTSCVLPVECCWLDCHPSLVPNLCISSGQTRTFYILFDNIPVCLPLFFVAYVNSSC